MRHAVTGISQCSLGVVRHGAGYVDWTWGYFSRIDVKTRNVYTL